MKYWLAGLLLLIGPASAQQAVPVIPFELGAKCASAAVQHVSW